MINQQARHNRLASAGVIGKQAPQRLTRKQLPVNGSDLVWQRVNARTVDSEIWVEQVREPNALGLGGDPEYFPITIEAERSDGLEQFEPRLGIPKERPGRPRLGRLLRARILGSYDFP
jgi:hypothetical protein